ncbi:5-oxoprolinase subunit PxpB [Kangiella sediminilitoris]|uniref:Allophanate hydrolase subunit 1 n=1 Tax=Kangiella sediminilitoris TaxID=1144748 RepID=A0A1B3BCX0_9GAMM|nr:5-oxoprolinase subunit PxpB [Kangiella sediminilitoris]AOE50587.1 Allophanate hydrolase subunit 1 [Kangiella sediminilitoris]
MAKPELHINSDNSIIIEFNAEISIELTRLILGTKESIEAAKLDGFVEVVPAYDSLLIIFKAEQFKPEACLQQIESIVTSATPVKEGQHQHHRIPVCYDKSFAPDLEYVADYCGLTTDELIRLHCSSEYPVFMLGFLPGFLYLGELDERLHCPRRSEPRPRIEAGSVAIGGTQTGVYPINSPGGWHIIGKTPIKMFDVAKEPPAIASPLDTISFEPISLEEFERYGD